MSATRSATLWGSSKVRVKVLEWPPLCWRGLDSVQGAASQPGAQRDVVSGEVPGLFALQLTTPAEHVAHAG